MYLVINYHRKTGETEKRAFDKLRYARDTYRNWELRVFLSGSQDHEITILEARNMDDIRRTHPKYFHV